MIYITWKFYFFVVVLLMFYYSLPLKFRWWVLLAGSLGFFYWIDTEGIWIFLLTILISYLLGLLLHYLYRISVQKSSDGKGGHSFKYKLCLFMAVLMIVVPLIVMKYIGKRLLTTGLTNLIVPLGMSFYTLQIISYLVDVYRGIIEPQQNMLKYALFVTFFPQIVQGPIPRYRQMETQLYIGHKFDERTFSKGLQLIIWGFFLKLMIADRAAVIVNSIFDNFPVYKGYYILIAGILYSIQLYTDFMACVVISQGTAALFGIVLIDNFKHPYQSNSVKEFWHRWHISLSSWLRDYIYIPLGGSRHGRLRKYINLALTFFISGLWHGTGYKYVCWGLLHALYQVVGEISAPVKDLIYNVAKMPRDSMPRKLIQTVGTFFWVMLAWVIFRAKSLKVGISMIISMFTTYNPWIFFDDSLLKLGLTWKECLLLLIAVTLLFFVERKQETVCIRDWILEQHLMIRWALYIIAICSICVFGVYGFGFDSQDFIYGGF